LHPWLQLVQIGSPVLVVILNWLKSQIMPSGEGSRKPSSGGTDKSKNFVVEKFIGKRFLRGRPQYLAKWEGFTEEESTWEPLENLANCMTLVADFEAELFQRSQEQHKPK